MQCFYLQEGLISFICTDLPGGQVQLLEGVKCVVKYTAAEFRVTSHKTSPPLLLSHLSPHLGNLKCFTPWSYS